MRSLLLVGVLVSAGCRTAAPQQPFHWTSNSQPNLGVTVDIDRGWQTTSLDNVVVLAPQSGGDDFAILVVRAPEQGADVFAALGTLEHIEMNKVATTPSPRVGEMQVGTAMLHSNHKPVALRLARITDAGTHATYVLALIAQPSGSRGSAAFDHVLQSLVINSASAEHAIYPEWLGRERPRPPVDDAPDDEESTGSDEGGAP